MSIEGRKAGVVLAGAALCARRHHLLWILYGLNLLLAAWGTVPLLLALRRVLDHSLAADGLYKRLDANALAELLSRPHLSLSAYAPASFLFSLLFAALMLFLSGGILETYRCGRALSPGEFFAACGTFLGRFVRMAILLGLVLLGLGAAGAGFHGWSSAAVGRSGREMLGFWLLAGEAVLLGLLCLVARIWFDIAQARVVAENEPRVLPALASGFSLTFRHLGRLFWLYLQIILVACAGLCLLFWCWLKLVRPERVGLSFLLTQAALLLWLGARLWQRASSMLWYQAVSATRVIRAPEAAAPPPSPGPLAEAQAE